MPRRAKKPNPIGHLLEHTLPDLPAVLADGTKLAPLGPTPDKRLRLNHGEMMFARHLAELRRQGRILWYAFNRITFTLADRTTLTIDFPAVNADREFLYYDVKASRKFKRPDGTTYVGPIVKEDAMVKMKAVARHFPGRFLLTWPAVYDTSLETWDWMEREI